MLYIDLHLIHEVTSPQAFTWLRERGLKVRRPERTVATMDHSTPTTPRGPDGKFPIIDAAGRRADRPARDELPRLRHRAATRWAASARASCTSSGRSWGSTQPGMTIVCGDSHTSTHGAFGALAFGIGTSEVDARAGHAVPAAAAAARRWPSTVDGQLRPGVTAKDIILAVIARIGIGGGTGHVIEYRGSAIRGAVHGRAHDRLQHVDRGRRARRPDRARRHHLPVPGRPPARAAGRRLGRGAWPRWRALPTDDGARFDREEIFDAATLEPMITYGTNPGHGHPDQRAGARRRPTPRMEKALRLHGPRGGQAAARAARSTWCSSAAAPTRACRDLRAAATRASRAARWPRACACWWCRARSRSRRQAEAEGLDRVFREAGAEWREAGCSMCIAMNGDQLSPGQYAVSTSNRNFEGRQGAGGRTFLASPLTAAAAARHRQGHRRPRRW